jgi:hypothetical protein
MTSSKFLLREFIELCLNEAWKNPPRPVGQHVFQNVGAPEQKETKKDRIQRGASIGDYREVEERHFEESIEDLMNSPEFDSVEAFIEYKLDDENYEVTAKELQALTRKLDLDERGIVGALPPATLVSRIKTELTDLGFTFVAREKVKDFRGSFSAAHGKNRFAGMGGGGSGVSNGGIGLGSGPGVVANSGRTIDANDPSSLDYGRSATARAKRK